MAAPAHAEVFDRSEPWTEEAFLALPEDRRVELVDGSLLVSPSARMLHQWLSFQLCTALNAAAPPRTRVLEAVNVRVAPGRILIPDLAVIAHPDLTAVTAAAADVQLVVEITSPGNLAVDRALKPQLYAQAGIPHLLRVELTGTAPTAVVLELHGDRYRETRRVPPGEITELTEPFPVSLDLAGLISTG